MKTVMILLALVGFLMLPGISGAKSKKHGTYGPLKDGEHCRKNYFELTKGLPSERHCKKCKPGFENLDTVHSRRCTKIKKPRPKKPRVLKSNDTNSRNNQEKPNPDAKNPMAENRPDNPDPQIDNPTCAHSPNPTFRPQNPLMTHGTKSIDEKQTQNEQNYNNDEQKIQENKSKENGHNDSAESTGNNKVIDIQDKCNEMDITPCACNDVTLYIWGTIVSIIAVIEFVVLVHTFCF